jgi:hypothetical protein
MSDNCLRPTLPDDIEAKIQEIANETKTSRDEVINVLMRVFFEMVDNPERKDVPPFVLKVRQALLKKTEASA